MSDCLFCKIIAGDVPSYKLYEDEHTYVFLDIFPSAKGHALVIPKEHAQDLTEGSAEAAKHMIDTVHAFAPKLVNALGATGYNLGMNHGKDAGQIIFHTHMHLIPRYDGDDRSFDKREATPEELMALQEEIVSKLDE